MKARAGYKYIVETETVFTIPSWFPVQYRVPFEYEHIKLTSRELILQEGYAWNGANAFPDWDWVIVPSAVHDAMLWVLHFTWSSLSEEDRSEMKRAIDRWFCALAKERMPWWRRWLTPTGLFIGVNWMSRLLPGSQAETHRVREYP